MVPLMIQTITLSVIGLGGGWYLGFGPGQGLMEPVRQWLMPNAPAGAGTMWLMAGLGLLTSGLLLYSWYRRIVLAKLNPRP
jgi:MATE family multidrug resistance protein